MRTERGVRIAGALLVGWAWGCAPANEGSPRPETELVSSMEVQVGQDAVRLALHVTNPTAEPIRLEFRTAQRYDFVVQRPDGEEVWRWSADRMFAQVLGTETVEPGETLRYGAVWEPGGRTGEFVAVGRLTASDRRVEQRARFEVGGS